MSYHVTSFLSYELMDAIYITLLIIVSDAACYELNQGSGFAVQKLFHVID